jgi:hypothetical protein
VAVEIEFQRVDPYEPEKCVDPVNSHHASNHQQLILGIGEGGRRADVAVGRRRAKGIEVVTLLTMDSTVCPNYCYR